jgi:hypothetical protein
MHIETITSRESDTEICVTCPQCRTFEYFDPRPWRHCEDCMAIRASDFIRVCPKCGPSPATGDVEWLPVCTTVEAGFTGNTAKAIKR